MIRREEQTSAGYCAMLIHRFLKLGDPLVGFMELFRIGRRIPGSPGGEEFECGGIDRQVNTLPCGQNGASVSEPGEGVLFSFREDPATGGLCRIILDLNFDQRPIPRDSGPNGRLDSA